MEEKKQAILAEIPNLRRYARALLRDPDAADDLVQDCLERALSRLDNWQTGESPRRWLFTVMHHLFIDEKRRARRRGRTLVESPAGNEDAAVAPVQLDVLASRDVLDALQGISADRRAALLLVAVEGLSYAQAATVLEIPTGTLMSRIARGREELRVLLDRARRRKSIRVVEK
ncbi:RNA polymerase sigma-70 factor (ECF subfamily) [Mesorhizobium sp. J18]|uniref:sigma-70 family RNA polymerase sigma factor n=1 Tax=Mesorhizobium sp. J18 TaxID=935263 RepID=UPI0011995DA2|nr:sigma-70 family RNA polymerase sigma factor [Mesorhizobium sp. J18]TWG94681.1 RNA polymerase sigma-70 factor (ECF subfamily) [Mesorhizobium sp. J18]